MFKKLLVFLGLLLPASVSLAGNAAASDSPPTQHRIFMLEKALAPATSKGVAQSWARAAENRNGAVQYMLMCPDLRKSNLANLEALNWVTGTSSPWISGYKVMLQRKKGTSPTFIIQYQFAMGGGKVAGIGVDHVSVIHADEQMNSSQKWCIEQFKYLSPVDGLGQVRS